MKKIQFLVVFICMYTSKVSAQEYHYGGMQQFQFNFGQSGSNVGLNVINGLRFGRFFTGIGADAQLGRSYPFSNWYGNNIGNSTALFIDGRYYINKDKTFFAKLNGGVNLLYGAKENSEYSQISRFPGFYGACGLGLKVRLTENVFYVFDISYTMRQFRYDYKYLGWNQNQWTHEKYDIRRYFISVNMGLELF